MPHAERTKDAPPLCALCGRAQPLTFHHLIPRALHKRPRYKKRYTKEELRTLGIDVCQLCHNGLHDLFTKHELGESYMTKEALLEHPAVQKHVAWVRKQK